MSDDTENPEENTDELSEEEQEESGGLNVKKIVLFVILPLLLIGGGGTAAYFTGVLDSMLGLEAKCEDIVDPEDPKYEECQIKLEKAAEEEAKNQKPGLYYDIPDIRVNLNGRGSKQKFLFLSIKIEVPDQENLTLVEQYVPRVMDHFQTYLREIRIEDLQGSAGIYRLRRELLERVNAAAPNLEVNDVLFQEMLVQ